MRSNNIEIMSDKDDINLLILEYLKSNNYMKSLVSLESESGVQLEDSGQEIAFFRDVILNGDFEEALRFIDLFKKSADFPHKECLFAIKKQKFLELVENNSESNLDELVKLTKDLEGLTDKNSYNELCFFLTLSKITDHPDYANWNIYKGRMEAFNEVKKHMKKIFPKEKLENQKVKSHTLIKMLTALLNYELGQNKELSLKIKYEKDHVFSFIDPIFVESIENSAKAIRIDFLDKEPQINKNMYASINFANKKQDDHFGIAAASMILEKNQFKNETFGPNFGRGYEKPQEKKSNLENMSPNQGYVESMQALAQSQKFPTPQQKGEEYSNYRQPEPIPSNFTLNNKSGISQSQLYKSNIEDSARDTFEQFHPMNSPPNYFNNESENAQTTRKVESGSENEKNVIIEKLLLTETQRGETEREEKPTFRVDVDYDQFSGLIEEIGLIQDVQPIRTACFSPDGGMFAIGTNSKSLKLYSIRELFLERSGKNPGIELVFEKANHHFGSIYTVDWSNTGKFIASGSNDKLVKIISVPDFENDTELMELKLSGHKGIVRSVAFTQDDSRLLSASADCTIKLWDVQEGAEMRTLEGHSNAVYCIQASGDGNNCVSVGMDKSLRLWDVRAPKCMLSIQMNDYAEMNYVSLSENTKNYNTMRSTKKSINQSYTTIYAGVAHNDGLVTLWDLSNRKILEEIKIHEADCRSVEYDAYSGLIATSSFDSTIGLYDVNEKIIRNRIQNHTDRVVLAKWHPFYPIILSTSADSTARLFAPKKFMNSFN